MTPTQVGPYVVERELGRGAMGVVYLARHTELGRRVALKMLLEVGVDPDALARFEREAQALARLRHPNLLGVHEAGVHEGRPFLAMELVEGRSLQDRLDREGPLSPGEVAAFGETVARAIHYAHERGLLHRDLKPSNVLLTAEGRPVIADFGLAKLLDVDAERLTRTGTTLGTPEYMPPEQVAGERDVDRRADVYSLGATLYALLCGRPPFKGATALNVVMAVVSRDPEPLLELRPEVGAALDAVCRMCLAKAPEERYPTAEALADDLARVRQGEAVHADPPRPRSAARPVALAISGVTVVLVLLLLAVLQATREPETGSAGPSQTPPPPVEPAGPEEPSPEATLAALLQAAPEDPTRLEKLAAWLQANPEHPQAHEARRRYDQHVNRSRGTTLPEARANEAAFLDERTVAVGGRTSDVVVWDLLTLQPTASWTIPPDGVASVAGWPPGGGAPTDPRWACVLDRELWRFDARGQAQRTPLPPELTRFRGLACGPDGLVAVGARDLGVVLVGPEGSPRRLPLDPEALQVLDLAFAPRAKRLLIGAQAVDGSAFGSWLLWDLEAEQLVKRGMTSDVLAVAVSPAEDVFATSTRAGWVVLHDLKTGTELAQVPGSTPNAPALAHPATALVFSRDGERLYAGSGLIPAPERGTKGDELIVIDVRTATVDQRLPWAYPLEALALSPRGDRLLTVSRAQVEVWPLTSDGFLPGGRR